VPFVILDANARVGDAWRNRWDSLRLFTPALYSQLVGMRSPGAWDSFPTKDEMADYLEQYARRFAMPVRTNVRVERLARRGDRYELIAGDRVFQARNVVVAMATYQQPRLPALARELSHDILQLHSSEYRNPAQLRDGDVSSSVQDTRVPRSRSTSPRPIALSCPGETSARCHSTSKARS
jgi:putative flavoprotein involved in K+ transport